MERMYEVELSDEIIPVNRDYNTICIVRQCTDAIETYRDYSDHNIVRYTEQLTALPSALFMHSCINIPTYFCNYVDTSLSNINTCITNVNTGLLSCIDNVHSSLQEALAEVCCFAVLCSKQYTECYVNGCLTSSLQSLTADFVTKNENGGLPEAIIANTDFTNASIVTQEDSSGNPIHTATLQEVHDRLIQVENAAGSFTDVQNSLVNDHQALAMHVSTVESCVNGAYTAIINLQQTFAGAFTLYNDISVNPTAGQLYTYNGKVYQYTRSDAVLGDLYGIDAQHCEDKWKGWLLINRLPDDVANNIDNIRNCLDGVVGTVASAASFIRDDTGNITGWGFADGSHTYSSFTIHADHFKIVASTPNGQNKCIQPFCVNSVTCEIELAAKVCFKGLGIDQTSTTIDGGKIDTSTLRVGNACYDCSYNKYYGTGMYMDSDRLAVVKDGTPIVIMGKLE